jgi:UDP-N-acetylmuramoyl-tripeptide--D-alanyl-D-alanine ligase
MIRFELDEAARITGADLRRADAGAAAFAGMTQDTRGLQSGNLYAALVGERVDGHRFVADAAAAGAGAALVGQPVDAAIPQLVVDDVVRAMGRLARAWRARLPVQVVGITGSNGKTTVKTLLASILSRTAPTLATAGNYNNEIGVPLTLAMLSRRHRFAVVEMGCGQPGDIAYLADLAAPAVGVVTNAGPAHLERLGSVEGVARTKGELFSAIEPDGVAVINRDDDFHDYWCGLCPRARRITFGVHAEADVRLDVAGGTERVVTPAGAFDLELALPGAHNRMNALAATAAAYALDVGLDAVAVGLADVDALPGRLAEREMPGGWHLIDDSYNANPASLYAGLQVLAARPGRRWLVLGDMAELGVESDKLHREIGQACADLGVERVFAIGPHAETVVHAFGADGEAHQRVDALVERIAALLAPDVTCLVKGSRSSHMERVVQRLEDARC